MTVTKNLNRANSSLKHSLVINNLIEYASRKKNQKKKQRKQANEQTRYFPYPFPSTSFDLQSAFVAFDRLRIKAHLSWIFGCT